MIGNEHTRHADFFSSLHVAGSVAHHKGPGQVESPIAFSMSEHSASRFSTIAYLLILLDIRFGMMRAIMDGIYHHPMIRQNFDQVCVNFQKVVLGEKTSGDSGLVSYDDEIKSAV